MTACAVRWGDGRGRVPLGTRHIDEPARNEKSRVPGVGTAGGRRVGAPLRGGHRFLARARPRPTGGMGPRLPRGCGDTSEWAWPDLPRDQRRRRTYEWFDGARLGPADDTTRRRPAVSSGEYEELRRGHAAWTDAAARVVRCHLPVAKFADLW